MDSLLKVFISLTLKLKTIIGQFVVRNVEKHLNYIDFF